MGDFGSIITAVETMNGLQLLGVLTLGFLLIRISKGIIAKRLGKKKIKYPGLESIIDRVIDNKIRIFEIKRYETLEVQLAVVDRTIIQSKAIVMGDYCQLLGDEPGRDRDIRAFDKIWDYVTRQVKCSVKAWIQKNHILERTDSEFNTYTEKTADTLIDLTTTLMDEQYLSVDFHVSREDLREYGTKHSRDKYKRLLIDMLYAIREVAKTKRDKIIALEEENKRVLGEETNG